MVTVSQFRPHPVHGISMGREPPEFVNAYIEITPFDLMKYEVDKLSGYLRLDRPQRTSATPPSLYGFIPRTHSDKHVARLSRGAKRGDGDPLDICVLSERPVVHNEIIVPARVIGGFELNDGGEADDKIIAVIENDHVWGNARSLSDVPAIHIERLQHYFLTYKLVPGKPNRIKIARFYNRAHALRVIRAAMRDYADTYSY